MKTYIEKLYGELHELSTQPVCRRSVEEAAEIAELICVLEKLERKCDFTEADAREWTAHMENTDGTTGPHWTMDQTSAIADSMGIPEHEIPRWAWGVAMNMMHSDYYPVAVEFGLNRPEFYAALAKAFLLDKDGPGPERKLMKYYEHVVK